MSVCQRLLPAQLTDATVQQTLDKTNSEIAKLKVIVYLIGISFITTFSQHNILTIISDHADDINDVHSIVQAISSDIKSLDLSFQSAVDLSEVQVSCSSALETNQNTDTVQNSEIRRFLKGVNMLNELQHKITCEREVLSPLEREATKEVQETVAVVGTALGVNNGAVKKEDRPQDKTLSFVRERMSDRSFVGVKLQSAQPGQISKFFFFDVIIVFFRRDCFSLPRLFGITFCARYSSICLGTHIPRPN